MLSVFSILTVILLLAFLTESLVEYLLGAIIEHVQTLEKYAWLQMYVAAAVGIVGAFIYKFDFLHLLGKLVEEDIAVHWFGIALTGLAIGRGANYIHDIVSRYFKKIKPEIVE